MEYRFETFKDDKGIVVLQAVKVYHLSVIPDKFYKSQKLKNWMCELDVPKSSYICRLHSGTQLS